MERIKQWFSQNPWVLGLGAGGAALVAIVWYFNGSSNSSAGGATSADTSTSAQSPSIFGTMNPSDLLGDPSLDSTGSTGALPWWLNPPVWWGQLGASTPTPTPTPSGAPTPPTPVASHGGNPENDGGTPSHTGHTGTPGHVPVPKSAHTPTRRVVPAPSHSGHPANSAHNPANTPHQRGVTHVTVPDAPTGLVAANEALASSVGTFFSNLAGGVNWFLFGK